MGELLRSPGFLISYAVVQTVVCLVLIRLLDLYEYHSLAALAVMTVWGAVGATALAALGNEAGASLLGNHERLVWGPAVVAPVVEEVAKGVPLLAALTIAAWAHRRFATPSVRGVTAGLVYGAAVGLGFAFTEDVQYFLANAAGGQPEAGAGTFLVRRDFAGTGALHHAVFTGAFGASVGLAAWAPRRAVRAALPLAGLLAAVALHAFNNGIVELTMVARHGFAATAHALSGGSTAGGPGGTPTFAATGAAAARAGALVNYLVLAAFAALVARWQSHQRGILRVELAREADAGLIDDRDAELVPHFFRRTRWYWALFCIGELARARLMRRYHVELANLAFLEWSAKRGAKVDETERASARRRVANLRAATVVDRAPPAVGAPCEEE